MQGFGIEECASFTRQFYMAAGCIYWQRRLQLDPQLNSR